MSTTILNLYNINFDNIVIKNNALAAYRTLQKLELRLKVHEGNRQIDKITSNNCSTILNATQLNFRKNDIDTQLHYHGHGPAGVYDQMNWKVRTGKDATDRGSQAVSVHEFMHNELNNTSSYGFLLQSYAYLSRENTPFQAHYNTILYELIECCRTAHEVYATWMSMNLLSTGINDQLYQELLADNEEYFDYYNWAAQMVQWVPDLYLRRQIISAVINICFQSQVIMQTAAADLTAFDPLVLNRNEFPDYRLKFITQNFTSDDWLNMLNKFIKTQYQESWYDLLQDAISGNGNEKLLSDAGNETNSATLIKFIYDQIDAKLKLEDLLSLPYLEHLYWFKKLLPLLDELAPFNQSANPLAINTQPYDITRSTLQNFENETLLFTNRPLACIILQPEHLSTAAKAQILGGIGDYPHIFVAGRTYFFMKEQYVFASEEDAAWCAQGSGSFTAIRYATIIAGKRNVTYIPFLEPAKLKDFLKDLLPGVPVLSSVSESACYDEGWWDQWGGFFADISATTCISLDISPLYYIEKILCDAAVLLYGKMDIIMEDLVKSAMLFQVKNDKQTLVLIAAPCSEIYARGLHHYIQTRFPSFKNKIDLAGEHLQNLPAIISHVFKEEHQYSYRSKA